MIHKKGILNPRILTALGGFAIGYSIKGFTGGIIGAIIGYFVWYLA